MKTCPNRIIRENLYFTMLFCVIMGLFASITENYNFVPWYRISFVPLFIYFLIVIEKKHVFHVNRALQAIITILYLLIIVLTGILFPSKMLLKSITLMGNFLMLVIIDRDSPHIIEIRENLIIGMIGAIILCYEFYNSASIWWNTQAYSISSFNPQATGCWAFIFFLVALIVFSYFGEKRGLRYVPLRILMIALMIYLFWITLQTRTRIATLSSVTVLILHFIPMVKIIKKKWFCIVCTLLPAISVIVSLMLYFFDIGKSMSGGSLLNGREVQWIEGIKMLLSRPFFGRFYSGDYFYFHNILIDYLVCYGAIITSIFFVYIYKCIYKCANRVQSKFQYNMWISFVGCLLCASAESFIFSTGGGGVFVIAFSFLFLSKYNKVKKVKARIALGE